MGPIQTALNKLVGSVSAAVVGGAKLKDHEGQIREEEAAALKAERAKKAAEKKEAAAVATEADLRNLGASDIEARAYRLAQERGIANPKRMIFDKEGKPIATYEEMATLLADVHIRRLAESSECDTDCHTGRDPERKSQLY